ncbi:unnamed protein product [Paramecium sonneborni]|uniref:Uncharacterized protein n=1 Tax=Paramecium sonneborni TaxID=65129 RepID=A0A8S1KHN9_9CILI|nr:unnamed protein product [Paramecium sonneborni]
MNLQMINSFPHNKLNLQQSQLIHKYELNKESFIYLINQ